MSESATARASSASPDAIKTVTRRVRRTADPAPTAGIRAADRHYPSWKRGNFVAVSRGGGDSAIANALAAQDAGALDRRAGLVLDRELSPTFVAVLLVADLGFGGDAGRVGGRRADRRRFEDAGLLGSRAKAAAVPGEVVR